MYLYIYIFNIYIYIHIYNIYDLYTRIYIYGKNEYYQPLGRLKDDHHVMLSNCQSFVGNVSFQ